MNTTKLVQKCESNKLGVVDNHIFLMGKGHPAIRKAYRIKFLKAFNNAIDKEEFLKKHQESRERYKEIGMKYTDRRSFKQLLTKQPEDPKESIKFLKLFDDILPLIKA